MHVIKNGSYHVLGSKISKERCARSFAIIHEITNRLVKTLPIALLRMNRTKELAWQLFPVFLCVFKKRGLV
jgi:hypothetical protein